MNFGKCFCSKTQLFILFLFFVVYDAEPWFYADITRQECEEMLKQVTTLSAIIFKYSNIYFVYLIAQTRTRYVKKLLYDRRHLGAANQPFFVYCLFSRG